MFRSIIAGNMACAYVLVQMRRRMTSSSDWKLKRADCGVLASLRGGLW